MRIFQEGEQLQAICDEDGLVTMTLRYRDVPLSDGSGVVPHILAGVCDVCGHVIATLPQSTPKIRETIERIRREQGLSVDSPDLIAL